MIRQETTVTNKFVLELTGGEMLALDAITGYGVDPFLKVFYEKLGSAYLKPHQSSCEDLFSKVINFNVKSKVRASK